MAMPEVVYLTAKDRKSFAAMAAEQRAAGLHQAAKIYDAASWDYSLPRGHFDSLMAESIRWISKPKKQKNPAGDDLMAKATYIDSDRYGKLQFVKWESFGTAIVKSKDGKYYRMSGLGRVPKTTNPFSETQLGRLRSEYGKIERVLPERLTDFHRILGKMSVSDLRQLRDARVKWLSQLSVNELSRRGVFPSMEKNRPGRRKYGKKRMRIIRGSRRIAKAKNPRAYVGGTEKINSDSMITVLPGSKYKEVTYLAKGKQGPWMFHKSPGLYVEDSKGHKMASNPELMVMLNKGRRRNPRHVMDAETVHNWMNRYAGMPHYADLSSTARNAVKWAHDQHHRGTDADDLARFLIQKHPEEFSATGRNPRRSNPLSVYHPEMGEKRPGSTVIDAQLSHYGKHWFIKTPLSLKGRGVKFLRTLRETDLVPQARHKAGWHEYKVTYAAFEALKDKHSIATEALLNPRRRSRLSIRRKRTAPSIRYRGRRWHFLGLLAKFGKRKAKSIWYAHRRRKAANRRVGGSRRSKLSPAWSRMWAGMEKGLRAKRAKKVMSGAWNRRGRKTRQKLLSR